MKSLNWTQIDTDRPECFIDYLDTATAQAEMKRYKQKTYDLLGAIPGAILLDVGCGTGDDAMALADRVSPHGKVVGVDASATLIAEAGERSRPKNLPVTFTVGDIHHLEFADNSFDGCRADRLFMHLKNPQQALAEMVRVTRPGGRVLVREPDWETLVVDGGDTATATLRERDLTRQILNLHFDTAMPQSCVGRQLYRWFRKAGLENVAVADTSTLILTDFATANRLYGFEDAAMRATKQLPELSAEISNWLAQLQQADRDRLFFSAVTGFTVVGCKPN